MGLRDAVQGPSPTGATIMMDAHPEHGGIDAGPSPMETLLMALAGCTGMDVISILKRMRAPVDQFTIDAHADRATGHPQVLTRIHLRYVVSGKGLSTEQVRKAVALSQDHYCSVLAMLRKAAPVTYDIVVEETTADRSDVVGAAPAA